jgi:hypothetical protein
MAVFSASQTFINTDPTFAAAGDIIYGTANDASAVLSIGSNNQMLQVSACGLPEWVSCVTIPGDLVVEGTTTTISSTVTTIADPLVIYSQGTTGTPTKDSGFIVERGCSANVGIIWDESADEFAIVGCTSETGTTAGNVTITAYGNLHAADVIVGSNIELGHATDTTLARASSGDVNIQCNIIYRAGGTDVPLADGGTGASLSDPGADRLLFWDDGSSTMAFLTAGSGLTICGTSMTASGGASVGFSMGLFG